MDSEPRANALGNNNHQLLQLYWSKISSVNLIGQLVMNINAYKFWMSLIAGLEYGLERWNGLYME